MSGTKNPLELKPRGINEPPVAVEDSDHLKKSAQALKEIAQSKMQLEEDDEDGGVTVKVPEAAAMELEPANTEDKLESGLTSNDSSNLKFIYPLRTHKFELQNFFNGKEFEKYQKNAPFKEFLKDHLMPLSGSNPDKPNYHLKYNSAQAIIPKMPFDMYWDFRNYQIEGIKGEADKNLDLLTRLHLTLNENKELIQTKKGILEKILLDFPANLLPIILKLPINKFDFNSIYTKTEELIKYYNQLKTLYTDVSIAVDDKDKQKSYIKHGDKTLVTITTDHTDNKNNMIFKIDASLKGAELDKAILLMIDQSTRQQERSRDNQLEISGYKNNPEMALRIYQLAILERSKPEIHKDTIAAWEEKAGGRDNKNPTPEQAKFLQALAFHDKYKELANKPLLRNRLSRLINLKKELEGTSLKEYLAQKQPTSAEEPAKSEDSTQHSAKRP